MTLAQKRVIIGIITYKRPNGLHRLLASLRRLRFRHVPRPDVTIVVADNDEDGSAESVCRDFLRIGSPVVYVKEVHRGIPFARNAVLRAAQGQCDFLAFVDDDEHVEPTWLDELLRVQQKYKADVVAGPVLPVFAEQPPSWIENGRHFDRKRHTTGSTVAYVASGNVLVRSSLLDQFSVWFDARFAMSGGSDTLFFMQLRRVGAVMVWADEAIVHELIPSTRANPRWLCRRAFRSGLTMSRCETAIGAPLQTRFLRAVKGFGRIVHGIAVLLMAAVAGKSAAVAGLQYVSRGCGSILGVFGASYDEYLHTHGE